MVVRPLMGSLDFSRDGGRVSPRYAPGMLRSELFLGTVDDLLACAQESASEYRVLTGTALLRKLLMDGDRNLTDQVRNPVDVEEYHVARLFVVTATDPFSMWAASVSGTLWLEQMRRSERYSPELENETRRWFKDGVEYETVSRARLDREGFLSADVGRHGEERFSVRQVVHYAAYVMGGVHAGVASSEEQRRLDLFIQQIERPGLGNLGDTLRGIAFTVWEAMQPTAQRLRDELGG